MHKEVIKEVPVHGPDEAARAEAQEARAEAAAAIKKKAEAAFNQDGRLRPAAVPTSRK